MRAFSTYFSAIVLLAGTALAQDGPGQCASKCIKENLAAVGCADKITDGTKAYDDCMCNNLPDSDLVSCVKECPDEDQTGYAMTVPKKCRSDIFPDADTSGPGLDDLPDLTGGDGEGDGEGSGDGGEEDAAVGLGIPGFAAVGGGLLAALFL